MIIFVDIDETICYYENCNQSHCDKNVINYESAKPYHERIQKINKLYEEGNTIIYWTSRGSRTGKNWFKLTLNQLSEWNAKYTELRLGKPHYDLFIDDKTINSINYFDS